VHRSLSFRPVRFRDHTCPWMSSSPRLSSSRLSLTARRTAPLQPCCGVRIRPDAPYVANTPQEIHGRVPVCHETVPRRAVLRVLGLSVVAGSAGCNALDDEDAGETATRTRTTAPTVAPTTILSPTTEGEPATPTASETRTDTPTTATTPTDTRTSRAATDAGTLVPTPTPGGTVDEFGRAVALPEDAAIILAEGHGAYVFEDDGGWSPTTVVTPDDGEDFGGTASRPRWSVGKRSSVARVPARNAAQPTSSDGSRASGDRAASSSPTRAEPTSAGRSRTPEGLRSSGRPGQAALAAPLWSGRPTAGRRRDGWSPKASRRTPSSAPRSRYAPRPRSSALPPSGRRAPPTSSGCRRQHERGARSDPEPAKTVLQSDGPSPTRPTLPGITARRLPVYCTVGRNG